MIDKIQEYPQELINALQVVKDKGAKKYVTHVFDCSFFQNYTLENIREFYGMKIEIYHGIEL